MPGTIYHVFTNAIPDSTDTQWVRPSDWNSSHAVTLAPSGQEMIGGFSNANGISFGTNGAGAITASYTVPGGGGGNISLSVTGNTVSDTTASGNTFYVSGGPNITAGFTGNTLFLSGGAGAAGNTGYLSAGTTNASLGTISFANSNGVSFGVNGQTLTATVKTDYLTTAALSNHSHGFSAQGGSSTFQTLSFSNQNNVSFSNSDGQVVASASFPAQTVQPGIQSIAVSDTTYTTGQVSFSNANGISFGSSAGGAITASYTVPTQTAQTVGLYANGNTTGQSSSSTMDARSLSFSGAGVASVGYSNGQVLISVPSGGGAGDGVNALVINGGASTASTTLTLSNSNNVTFGLNAGVITASASFPAQTVQTQGLVPALVLATNSTAGGTATVNNSSLSFLNTNGVTAFQTNGSQVAFSVKTDYQSSNANYLTSQSNQAYSAANGSATFQTLTFANSNGVSFSTGTQGVFATVATNYLTTARASTDAIGLNTAQSNVTWTVNSSGLSLDARGYAGTGTTFNGANISGSITQNSNGIALSLSAPTPGGGAAINVSAGTTSGNLQTLQFNNSNGVSFGLNGSTITASAAGGGGGGGLTAVSLLGNQVGNNTVGLDANSVMYFSGGDGITLSGTGSTLVISNALQVTLSSTHLFPGFPFSAVNTSLSNQYEFFIPFNLVQPLSVSAVELLASVSCNSSAASSGQVGHTVGFGLYTRNSTNANVINTIASATYTMAGSYSSNASSALSLISDIVNSTSYSTFTSTAAGASSIMHGPRVLKLPLSTLLTPGQYWLGLWNVSSGAGTAGNMLRISLAAASMANYYLPGTATGTSNPGIADFLGIGSTSSTTLMASVSLPTLVQNAAGSPVAVAPIAILAN